MKNLFVEHPHQHGETYWQHMYFATVFAAKLIKAGIACLLHAIFPFIFKTYASDTVFILIKQFVERIPEAQQRVVNLAKPYLINSNLENTALSKKAFKLKKKKAKVFFMKKYL